MNDRVKTYTLAVLALIFFLIPAAALADMGPKPEIEITVINPPSGEYYLDLLIPGDKNYDNLEGQEYDPVKLALLSSYSEDGWYPALTNGTDAPLWGSLTGTKKDAGMIHTFSYFGVPDDFKIIIVTPDNLLIVSEPIHRDAFQFKLTYDYEKAQIVRQSPALSYLIQFFTTYIPTLVIEGLILLLFGFSLKQNYIALLTVNFITQVILTVSLVSTALWSGILTAYVVYLPLELVIIIAESITYAKVLKQHKTGRRVGYAITANIVSFLAGILLLAFSTVTG
jgi:hypothetical protein